MTHDMTPAETIQKILSSTTSRLTGHYRSEQLLIAPALHKLSPEGALRTQETPVSRSSYMIVFQTAPQVKKPGAIVPDYSGIGETVCSLLSVLYGKRFDCNGSTENCGHYYTPDLSSYSTICDPRLPINSHSPRTTFPVPLKLDQTLLVEHMVHDNTMDDSRRTVLFAACRFYMLALQATERDIQVAYLHLITAGEILSGLANYSSDELLSEQVASDLRAIRTEMDDGGRIAKRIANNLRSIKKRFVRFLCSSLCDDFFETPEVCTQESKAGCFKREDIEKNVGAAYDLRSRYVHTGVSFGMWVSPFQGNHDLHFMGTPVVGDNELAKILKIAAKFIGLERLIRYRILTEIGVRKHSCSDM